MADTITRCPKCQTSFRITEAHLKSAKGAVRCGSCLNIFNARAHLTASESSTTPAAEASKTNKTKPVAAKAAAKTQKPLTNKPKPKAAAPKIDTKKPSTKPSSPPPRDDEDSILISDDMPLDYTDSNDDSAADFNDNILYSRSLGSQESNLFEREPLPNEGDESEVSDESWALDLLENHDDDELPTFRKDTGSHPAVEATEYDTTSHPSQEHRPEEYTENDYLDSGPSSNHEAVSGGYEDMDADQLEEELRKTGFHEPVFTSIEPSLAELEEIAEGGNYDQHQSGYEQPQGDNTSKNQQFIHAIEPEPVEFSYKRDLSFLDSKLLWLPLCLIMLTALIAQIAWLQFDSLNRTEPYRSYYAVACTVVGCELSPLIDRTEIRAVNLVVRSHPQHEGALIVDAVLQNAANFAQSFPALELIFTDVQDKPVAARRFLPKEYLGGEMAGKRDIPSEQPVHIALEIVDPGPEAVSYRIVIVN